MQGAATSANFTQAAQARNVEAGLRLARQERIARRIVAQLERLEELERLVKLERPLKLERLVSLG